MMVVWLESLIPNSFQYPIISGYDLNNLGKGKGGGSCTAAAFLKEFVPADSDWIHADIAGVMCETSDQCYIGSSMTGFFI